MSALLLGITAFVTLVPTLSFFPSLGAYNEKRTLQIGVLIVITGVLLASRSVRQQWLSSFSILPSIARLGLGTMLGLGLLSAALAPAPFYAFLEVGHYVLLFAVAGTVATAVRFAPRWSQYILLGAVVAGAVLYIIHVAVGYGMYLTIPDIKVWPNGGTNFANIRFFNHYQTWTLSLLGGAIFSVPDNWRTARWGLFGLLAVWWSLAFAASAQGTLMAMGIAIIGVGVLFWDRAFAWIGTHVMGALAGYVLYTVLFSVMVASEGASPFGDQFSGDHPYPRLDHWALCLDMVWSHPWIGIGPMHFAWPPYQFTEPASPHSFPLRWLAEWGIVSTGILAVLGGWGSWRWIKQELASAKNKESGPLAVALVATALAGAAHSMVSGLLVAPLSQVMAAVIGGWIWGRYQYNCQPQSSNLEIPTFSSFHHVMFFGILIGSMTIVGNSLRALSTVEERREAFVEVKGGRFSPRYWQQGYIGLRDSSVVR